MNPCTKTMLFLYVINPSNKSRINGANILNRGLVGIVQNRQPSLRHIGHPRHPSTRGGRHVYGAPGLWGVCAVAVGRYRSFFRGLKLIFICRWKQYDLNLHRMGVSRKKRDERKEIAGEAEPAKLVVHVGALPPNRCLLDQLTRPFVQSTLRKALCQIQLERNFFLKQNVQYLIRDNIARKERERGSLCWRRRTRRLAMIIVPTRIGGSTPGIMSIN